MSPPLAVTTWVGCEKQSGRTRPRQWIDDDRGKRAVQSEGPRYRQIRRQVRLRIATGEYQPGAFIPSLNELAEEFEVNRLTVMKALEPLIGESVLRPVAGRGFCVVGERVARELETLDGFSRTMTELQAEPSVKVLSKGIRAAGPWYATMFGIGEDDDLYFITRLCLSAGRPFSLEKILFPTYVMPDPAPLQLSVFSLYDLYAFHGVNLATAHQKLALTRLSASDARILGIDEHTSVLLFECESTDDKGRVVEFTRTYTRGDVASFVTRFSR